MKIVISKTPEELGIAAAADAASYLKSVIAQKNYARIVVSTGASQFETLAALAASDVDWSRVEMFHLDEYVDLPESHPASFRKYLKERFVSKINLMGAYFVDGTPEGIADVSAKLLEKEVDLGLIGIGENSHIAFNDPPADFDTTEPYIVVTLNDTCRKQQAGEGWFATPADVPEKAVSMSVNRIMKCRKIISAVPHACKAKAVEMTLTGELSPLAPATMLKTHPDWTLYIDAESAENCIKVI